MEFKDRLRELRNRSGLMQEEFGKEFNVIKQTVSSWENGNSRPDIEAATHIADFFNITADYLLGRSDKLTEEVSEPKKPSVSALVFINTGVIYRNRSLFQDVRL